MPPATRHCQDGTRRGSAEHTSFTYLGFTFRARGMRTRHGKVFTGFGPAISKDALKKISAEVRSWRLHQHTGYTIGELARWINPVVRGWMQYYGAFYRSELYPVLKRINGYLMRWLRKKYKRLRTFAKAHAAWERATTQHPGYFAHWKMGYRALAVRVRRAR
jgi:RNA-directed DNA polymerase